MSLGPGIQKAIDFVRDRIASGELSAGARLPGRDDLARTIGVSARTISYAIARLKASSAAIIALR